MNTSTAARPAQQLEVSEFSPAVPMLFQVNVFQVNVVIENNSK